MESGESTARLRAVQAAPHHRQEALCVTRPRYRQGRKLTAVKVYTVADESTYLLINGVPSISLVKELKSLCVRHGNLLELKALDNYPKEAFTDVFLAKYESLRQARLAKKFIDGRNFFGGVLHVCYAPELESVEEAGIKLEERRAAVTRAIAGNEQDSQRSILAEYHPQDKLTASVKRISHRLKCQNDILKLKLEQLSARGNAELEGTDAGTIKPNYTSPVSGELESLKQNNESISAESLADCPMKSNGCCDDAVHPCETELGPCGSSGHQLDFALQSVNYSSGPQMASFNNQSLPQSDWEKRAESFEEDKRQAQMPEHHGSRALAGPALGRAYASMQADYEPGLGRIGGANYHKPNTARNIPCCKKKNNYTRKSLEKGWIEISDEIQKKKRKVQPKLSRLETRTYDEHKVISEDKRESRNCLHLNVEERFKSSSTVLRAVIHTEVIPPLVPEEDKNTASACRTEKISKSVESGAREECCPANGRPDANHVKSTLVCKGDLPKTGNNIQVAGAASRAQYLEAIRAAASTSFGPAPSSAVRSVSRRTAPKMFLKEDVKLV